MNNTNYYNSSDVELSRPNTFSNDIVIIDGQGRSGKNLIAVLLSTMERVEKMRLDSQIDYIPRYYALGKMSEDAAVTALRTEIDEKLYYNMISRDVNFRPDDYTGVLKQGKKWLYFKRLFQAPEEAAVKRIKEENPIFSEMTHDGIHLIPLYFKAFGNRLKFIHLFRDPVGNIYEQGRRDFGTRIGTDPRELQLTYLWNGNHIPLMALGLEETFLKANPTEKLVLMVDAMFRRNIAGYQKLDQEFKKNILFLEFEKFVQDPYPSLPVLENFLEDKFTKTHKRILKRENSPRVINPAQRQERIDSIRKDISGEFNDILDKLIIDYDQRPWESWSA